MFGSPRTLCQIFKGYFVTGYYYSMYNMSFKTIAGGFNGAFWRYGPLSEDLEEKKLKIYQNYIVACWLVLIYNTLIITNVAKRLFKYVPYILL